MTTDFSVAPQFSGSAEPSLLAFVRIHFERQTQCHIQDIKSEGHHKICFESGRDYPHVRSRGNKSQRTNRHLRGKSGKHSTAVSFVFDGIRVRPHFRRIFSKNVEKFHQLRFKFYGDASGNDSEPDGKFHSGFGSQKLVHQFRKETLAKSILLERLYRVTIRENPGGRSHRVTTGLGYAFRIDCNIFLIYRNNIL